MGLLRLVGEKTEKPDIISKLLDITFFKERPGYQLAEAENLVLFDCKYKDIEFQIPKGANEKFLESLMFKLYHEQMLKIKLIGSIIQNFKESVLKKDQYKIKKVIKKKNKKKKTIEESYKNFLYGKKNFMVPPDEMRKYLEGKRKKNQERREAYEKRIKEEIEKEKKK